MDATVVIVVAVSLTKKALAARTAIAAAFGLRVRDLDVGLFPPGVGAGRGFFTVTCAPRTPACEYLAVVMYDALGWHYRCRDEDAGTWHETGLSAGTDAATAALWLSDWFDAGDRYRRRA
ncbi:hypothetical protein [Nocardia nova]|jgi:hypothetical protein|uniref:hypothetical protein n=1 Tax=Nocardia nova TaxID=37330 RepID=UPI0007A4000A|nr:hypothetical protein [Nocardia nova]